MEINIVWCPMSERVGTVEVEDQIINLLSEKRKRFFHLGVGSFLKKDKKNINHLLSEDFIKFSLNKSFLIYGRFSVFIQSIKGLQVILKIILNNRYKKIVVYSCYSLHHFYY